LVIELMHRELRPPGLKPAGATGNLVGTNFAEKAMRKNKKSPSKSNWSAFANRDGTFDFEALSADKKEELYQECKSIGADEIGAPLTPAQRKLHERATRGRPRKGKGAQVVSLSIEKDLLLRAQRLAKALGLSRSELFSRGRRRLAGGCGGGVTDAWKSVAAFRGTHFNSAASHQ
jgi:hypothetical protein